MVFHATNLVELYPYSVGCLEW